MSAANPSAQKAVHQKRGNPVRISPFLVREAGLDLPCGAKPFRSSVKAFGVGLGEGTAPSPINLSEADRPAPKARQQKRENPDRILSFCVRAYKRTLSGVRTHKRNVCRCLGKPEFVLLFTSSALRRSHRRPSRPSPQNRMRRTTFLLSRSRVRRRSSRTPPCRRATS